MLSAVVPRPLPSFGAILPKRAPSQTTIFESAPKTDQVNFGSALGLPEPPPPLRIVLSPKLAKQTEDHPRRYSNLVDRWKDNRLYPPEYPGVLSRLHQNGWQIILDLANTCKPPRLSRQDKAIYVDVSEHAPEVNLKSEIARGIAKAINAGALQQEQAALPPLFQDILSHLQATFKLSDHPRFQKALEPLSQHEQQDTFSSQTSPSEAFEKAVTTYLLGNKDEIEAFHLALEGERALARKEATKGVNQYIAKLLEPYREISPSQD